jgi:hypothetical protein
VTVLTRDYKLVIRSADDTADALVFVTRNAGGSSFPTMIASEPSGDGQSYNATTGEYAMGTYSLDLIDNADSGLPVTAALVDAQLRQQLLSRRAAIYRSSDRGATWSEILSAGYVNKLRLVTTGRWAVTVGQSKRTQNSQLVWTYADGAFDRATCLIGSAIRGGWGPSPDLGGWVMTVVDVQPDFVTLQYVRGPINISLLTNGVPNAASAIYHTFPSEARDRLNARAKPFRVPDDSLSSLGIYSQYPRLVARVETVGGTFVGAFMPLGVLGDAGLGLIINRLTNTMYKQTVLLTDSMKVRLNWTAGGTPAQPVAGQQFQLYVYPYDVSADNPLHVHGHPVDIMTALADEVGDVFDAASAAAVRARLGTHLRVHLRFTAGMTYKKAQELLGSYFGIGRRIRGTQLEFYVARLRDAPAPTAPAITIADLRDRETLPSLYDLAEDTIVNKVVMKERVYDAWDRDDGGDIPVDGVTERTLGYEYRNGDALGMGIGDATLTLDLPGHVNFALSLFNAFTVGTSDKLAFSAYTRGIAEEIFDRRGSGAVGATLNVLPGVTVGLGDEVPIDLPFRPNNNARGGVRNMQVTHHSPRPNGADLVLEDSGVAAQPPTAPAFTLAAAADAPTSVVVLTLTNAAALATDGSRVRVEWAFGASAPTGSGTLLTVLDPATDSSLRTPVVDAGTTVWMRARSDQRTRRPGNFTAWQSVALTTLPALAGLTATPNASDGSRMGLAWPNTDTTHWVRVQYRLTSDSVFIPVALVPPGSTRADVTALTPGANYTFSVNLAEAPPLYGAGAAATVTATTSSAVPVALAPENPRPFAEGLSGGVAEPSGVFGLQVTATEFPATIRFEVATETAVGSGTPGTFGVAAEMPAVPNYGPTDWRGMAPNDGKRRYLRALALRPGATASAYTPVVSVDPWAPILPADYPIPVPTIVAAAYREGDPSGLHRVHPRDAGPGDGRASSRASRTRCGAGRPARRRGAPSGRTPTLLGNGPASARGGLRYRGRDHADYDDDAGRRERGERGVGDGGGEPRAGSHARDAGPRRELDHVADHARCRTARARSSTSTRPRADPGTVADLTLNGGPPDYEIRRPEGYVGAFSRAVEWPLLGGSSNWLAVAVRGVDRNLQLGPLATAKAQGDATRSCRTRPPRPPSGPSRATRCRWW